MDNRAWNEKILMVKAVHGICSMIVCCTEGTTDTEILEFCNRENPAGIMNGWCEVVRDDKKYPQRNPVPCGDEEGRGQGRKHIIVNC